MSRRSTQDDDTVPTVTPLMAARMTAETLVIVAVLVGIYWLLPAEPDATTATSAVFATMIVALLVTTTARLQTRRINRSRNPLATGLQSLLILTAVFVLGFAYIYYAMSTDNPSAFTEPLDRFDSLYFTVTILATVGFGDISAVSSGARLTVTVQMLAGLGFIAGLLRLVFGTAQRAHQRRQPPPAHDSSAHGGDGH